MCMKVFDVVWRKVSRSFEGSEEGGRKHGIQLTTTPPQSQREREASRFVFPGFDTGDVASH